MTLVASRLFLVLFQQNHTKQNTAKQIIPAEEISATFWDFAMFCIVYLAPLLCAVMTMFAPLHPLNNVRQGVKSSFNGTRSVANGRIQATKLLS